MVRALRDKGLVDYTVWGWVKTSAKFRAHIKILRGAKHDIWHYLALGVDEHGKCKETINQKHVQNNLTFASLNCHPKHSNTLMR